jgi:hypothetical protein
LSPNEVIGGWQGLSSKTLRTSIHEYHILYKKLRPVSSQKVLIGGPVSSIITQGAILGGEFWGEFGKITVVPYDIGIEKH